MNMPLLKEPRTKGERTRVHIVNTAALLFWRRNFHGVSVDHIADAANVNKATIYRYFADKADLALAVARFHGAATIANVFAATFDAVKAPQARLSAIYRIVHCTHSEHCQKDGDTYGCPLVGLALELGQELPSIRQEAQAVFDEAEAYFTIIAQDAIAEGRTSGDAKELARTLAQLMHGAFASARISADATRIMDAGRASLQLIGFPEGLNEPPCEELKAMVSA